MYHDTFRPMDWLKDLTRLFRTCWLNLSLISRRAGKSTWIHVCMRTTLPGMSHLSTVPSRLCLDDELFYQLTLLRIRYGILQNRNFQIMY